MQGLNGSAFIRSCIGVCVCVCVCVCVLKHVYLRVCVMAVSWSHHVCSFSPVVTAVSNGLVRSGPVLGYVLSSSTWCASHARVTLCIARSRACSATRVCVCVRACVCVGGVARHFMFVS